MLGVRGQGRLDPCWTYLPDALLIVPLWCQQNHHPYFNVGILKWCSRSNDVSLLPPAASTKILPYSTPCLFFEEVRIFSALTSPHHLWELSVAWSLISHETWGSDGWMIQCSLCIPHPLIGWRFTPLTFEPTADASVFCAFSLGPHPSFLMEQSTRPWRLPKQSRTKEKKVSISFKKKQNIPYLEGISQTLCHFTLPLT